MSKGQSRQPKGVDEQGRYKKSVSFRLTFDEWDRLRVLAHKDGAKMYEWARAAVLAAVEDAEPNEAEPDAEEPVLEHLARPVEILPLTDGFGGCLSTAAYMVSDVFLGGTLYALRKGPDSDAVAVSHESGQAGEYPSLHFDSLEDAMPVITATANARTLEEAAPYGLIVHPGQLAKTS